MKKTVLALALLALGACGTVTVKEGNRECTTLTFGIFGASTGAFLNNGCK
ncbi:MAG: hypothetical protein FWD15_03830 [Alphaproteobacteria bacterium]|nr:hypothetical protein [Alphaproteobacteria bacterium]